MKLERRGDAAQSDEPEKRETEQQITPAQREKTMRKRELAVLGYMGILFLAAAALIVLTYFMQRGNSNTIASITEQHTELQTHALDTIESLQQSYDELQKENDALEEENNSLQDQVDSLTDDAAQLGDTVSRLEGENETLKDELESSNESLAVTQNSLTDEAQRREALESLLRLYAESEKGEIQQSTLEKAQDMSQYLDEEFLTLYQQILSQAEEGDETDD